MQSAIQINDKNSRVYDSAAIARAVANCHHSLQAAEVQYWVTSLWRVLEQGYDLPDVYVSYLEITTTKGTAIPIRCPVHDLYGFYVLEGDVRITAANGASAVLRTEAGHYRLSYLPAASYTCNFTAGMHRIFYFVTKDSILFREPSPELGEDIGPVEALRAKLSAPAVSPALPSAGSATDAIQRFLHRPGTSYLRRYIAIHQLAITLLLDACEALRVQSSVTGQVGEAFAQRMRNYIDARVIDGQDIGVASLAQDFTVSYAYAKLIFRTYTGQPVGAYIRARKLEQARRMLKAGEPPTKVARYLCWSYGHFNKAFKARYGVPPRKYR